MIVSIAAGSLTDVIMRAAANELSPRLGQTIVIENRGGAAGIPGAQACRQRAGDGYMICVVFHNQLSFNPVMFNNLPYDADKDLVLITRLFFLIESLAVHPSINLNTVAELKALAQSNAHAAQLGHARRRARRPSCSCAGSTTSGAPTSSAFPIAAAARWRRRWPRTISRSRASGSATSWDSRRRQDQGHRGVGAALFAARAERDDVRGSRPRAYQQRSWWGLAAPKGTPEALVSSLNAEFVRLFSDPKFVAFLDKQSVVSAPTTPAGFADFIKQDRLLAANLVKLANTPVQEYKPGGR